MFGDDGPRYRTIMDNLKDKIALGELRPGDRMPTVRAVAATWHVSHATATKVLRELCREGYARVENKATYVRDRGQAQVTYRIQMTGGRLRGSGTLPLLPDWTEVTEAGIVTPPDYVADVMGIDRGTEVLRREIVEKWAQVADGAERIPAPSPRPVQLSVSWMPAGYAELLPNLLLTGPVNSTSPLRYGAIGAPLCEEATQRKPRAGLDSFHGRYADEREARLLGIAEGDAILARVTTWEDEQGVSEYVEACYPVGVVVSFEHRDPFDSDEE